jgi:hypothetical protein
MEKKRAYQIAAINQYEIYDDVDTDEYIVLDINTSMCYTMKIRPLDAIGRELYDNHLQISNKFNGTICPRIIAVGVNYMITELLHPISNEDNEAFTAVITPDLINAINIKIQQLHLAGYAHGNLCLSNISIRYCDNGISEPFLCNFEHAYQICNHSWIVEDWMRTGFCWDETYAEFVNNDYNFRSLLDQSIALPLQTPVELKEEWFVQRFGLKDFLLTVSSTQTFAETFQTLVDGSKMCKVQLTNNRFHYYILLQNGLLVDPLGVYRNIDLMIIAVERYLQANMAASIDIEDPLRNINVVHQYAYMATKLTQATQAAKINI